ncbi:MAG: exopolyphosphatase / guanosine-5-triphosphate,3-diphosphate pyrophosphatase [Actinomycetota bacterium]|nr:exopolyphosphatase / guanosine-5-triphosphate,3-diphosphate pyrophosphatase [Actinomycetota bacterium]
MTHLPTPEPDDRPFAVIDIGSNSGRMIVFRLSAGDHLDVIEDARAPLRLARALRDGDSLGPEAIERTLEACRDFRAVADGAGATRIIAVATSAVRDATDGEELVRRAARSGVPLQVIDGNLETRLGFTGAVHDLPVVSGFTMDVGGGSVELGRFVDRALQTSWTLPFGSLRVSDRFLESDPPAEHEMDTIRRAVSDSLDDAGVTELANRETVVGIGGTIRNLAKIDLRRTDYPLPLLHGYELEVGRLDALVKDLSERTQHRRRQVAGLNPDRADTIVGGGVVIQQIAQHLGASKIIVSGRGLREGLALTETGAGIPSPSLVRSISVATLSARFATWDPIAAERRTSLATALLDAIDPDTPPAIREMVQHAAGLVDVGRAIDYYERFEHAAMIVAAADLGGFSHAHLGALTAILRQADDASRLGPFGRLVAQEDRPSVLRAATALALAEELNRRIPPGRAPTITCNIRMSGFEVVAPVPPGWRPRGVAERFSRVFGRPLLLVPADSAAGGPGAR